ncbi:hypothetical protein [Cerasicoccus frondis]|uniref:hypothetical protein n=1 Tax=Cerasicoccus frondis TaxID=490090 RepID=UPI002852C692|nr:hypothetical protein [Cerasicoccus frondis]
MTNRFANSGLRHGAIHELTPHFGTACGAGTLRATFPSYWNAGSGVTWNPATYAWIQRDNRLALRRRPRVL